VRRTRDRALVIHHDASVPGLGPIVDLDAASLPRWMPTLQQAVDACDGMIVNVEVKSSPFDPDFDEDRWIAGAVGDMVRRLRWADRVLVSSFDLVAIDRVRATDAAIPTALLTLPGVDGVAMASTARDHGHRVLHPHDSSVTPHLVADLHGHGMTVNVWTVDAPARMRALAEMGVDGICTNVPDVLIGVLRDGRDRSE